MDKIHDKLLMEESTTLVPCFLIQLLTYCGWETVKTSTFNRLLITVSKSYFHNGVRNALLVGTGSVLDYSDFHGIASSINGIIEVGNSYILSDSKNQQVIWSKDFETEVLIDDMFRPTQIYLQQIYTSPGKHFI